MSIRLALFCGLALAGPAGAETPLAQIICAPRAEMELRLTRQYRATRAATGLRDADAMIEVWADADGRWTLVQRYATGHSCILAMGENWTMPPPPA